MLLYQYDKVGKLTQHKLTDYANNTGVTELFAFDPASNRVPVKYDEDKQSHKDSKPSLYADRAFTADTTTKSDTWKRTQTLKTHNKEIQYYYDKHGRIEFKTQTPLGKDGNALKQSHQSIVGYLDTLKLSYNANDELEKSVKIHQQGLKVTTTTTHYCYDAFGRRIAKYSDVKNQSKLVSNDSRVTNKTIQSEKTYTSTLMLWDGNRQAQEYTDTHVFTTVYEQDSFEPVARLVSNDNEFKIFYYHNDHLGTPNELTDENGNVVWLADYEAWGNVSKTCDAFKYQQQIVGNVEVEELELQPIRFQGQFFDSETQLHYNRFRYYDNDVGMFISRDPIGLMGGDNVFQYAPNPTGWIDPWGLSSDYRKNWRDRYNKGVKPSGHQIHHIIPKSKNVLDEVKKLCPSFDVHNANNLIALPERGVSPVNKTGYGKTEHQGSHPGYNSAVIYALKVAQRTNIPGVNGCMKIKAVRAALKPQLEKGGSPLNLIDTKTIEKNFIKVIRDGVRGL